MLGDDPTPAGEFHRNPSRGPASIARRRFPLAGMLYPSQYVLHVSTTPTERSTTMTKAIHIPKPKPIQEDEFLTIPEIAFLLRHFDRKTETWEPLKRASVEQLRVRYRDADDPTERAKELPEPDGYLGSVPYWRLDRILAWADSLSRKYDVDDWRAKRESGGFRRHQDLI